MDTVSRGYVECMTLNVLMSFVIQLLATKICIIPFII